MLLMTGEAPAIDLFCPANGELRLFQAFLRFLAESELQLSLAGKDSAPRQFVHPAVIAALKRQ
jgi:uncharacterized protein (DUF983 family)